jgi:hypothetical protein
MISANCPGEGQFAGANAKPPAGWTNGDWTLTEVGPTLRILRMTLFRDEAAQASH